MPCYYTGSAEGDRALAYEENAKELTKKLQQVTRVACELWKYLQRFDYGALLTEDTKRWCREHDKIDSKRRRKKQ